MKNHVHTYKEKLEKSIGEYMEMPVNERNASAVKGMTECWEEINRLEALLAAPAAPLTMDDVEHWNAKMVNEDGSMGGHWTIEQTTAVAHANGVEFTHITPYCFNVAMNMMYSDYCAVAEKYGVGTPEFYCDMAKAFLFDKDGPSPKEKLAAYYHSIVHPEKY